MTLRDLAEEVWDNHRGKLLGTLIGLFFALVIMWAGFLWAIFIFGCTFVGFFIGKRMDEHKENLAEVLDRILPPGSGD
jgi:uncharacterized membrane protein